MGEHINEEIGIIECTDSTRLLSLFEEQCELVGYEVLCSDSYSSNKGSQTPTLPEEMKQKLIQLQLFMNLMVIVKHTNFPLIIRR